MKIKLSALLLLLLLVSCWIKDNSTEPNIVVEEIAPPVITEEKEVDDVKLNEVESIKNAINENAFEHKVYDLIDSWNFVEAEELLETIDDKSWFKYLYFQWKLLFESKKFSEAIVYYLEADKVKWDRITDTMFMVWILYDNLWEIENSKKYLNIALSHENTKDLAKDYLLFLKKREEEDAKRLLQLEEEEAKRLLKLKEEEKKEEAKRLLEIDEENSNNNNIEPSE